MKKIELKTKLSLNKKMVTKLNENELQSLNGGGFTSLGRRCSQPPRCDGADKSLTNCIFCN